MHLKGWVPEILRMAMLAGEETNLRDLRACRVSQREGDLDRRAVRSFDFASEFIQFEMADTCLAKLVAVRRAAAFQHQHREAFAACQKIAIERAERKEIWCVRRDPRGIGDRQQ